MLRSMPPSWRYGVLLLALIACVGVVDAQDVVDDETTGTIGRGTTDALSLSDEQRGRIFVGVMNLPDVPEETLAETPLSTRLPETVVLQDLPAMVVRQVPMARGYKFVKLDDRILLVSPLTRAVVAEIPRFKIIQ